MVRGALAFAFALALLPAAPALAQNQPQPQPQHQNQPAPVPPIPQEPRFSPDGAWLIHPVHAPEVEAAEPWVRPALAQPLTLNLQVLTDLLAAAPLEGTFQATRAPLVISLPDPDGVLRAFAVVESPIMEPALAAQFPTIKTYLGQGLDDRAATLRMDVTLQGFHAMVRSPAAGHWFIDPYSRADTAHYSSYYKRNLKALHPWACAVAEQTPPPEFDPIDPGHAGVSILTSGPTLRTYRLAVAATGEYTAFHGGAVPLAQSAIVTAVNRVTGVYETELAIRLVLIGANSSIVYTNSATDPYTNANGSTMLAENQANLTSAIGSANYDIGHVFSTGGGGVALLGCVCTASTKAQGVTGNPAPTGDSFWIDYVAHEMGHQFGANHAFNGSGGNCSGGNRNASTAYEPGSGATIMNYAGICAADDLQPHSDAYFNFISINEIRNYITTGAGASCGTNSSTGNSAPSVSALSQNGLTIPKATPFALTATANDPNADALTYCWEERDLGPAAALNANDDGLIPLFRSFNPSSSPTRTFPALAKIIAGTSDASEKLPSVARPSFKFTVTARDNRAGAGGVERADIALAVSAAAGPFIVTSPSASVSWPAGSLQTVTWNVAGTTANGVNTASVAILLSTDAGLTFPITLLASTPNSGSASFTVPNNQTAAGRIRVQALGNVFFNIAPGVVAITPPVNGVVLSGAGTNAFSDSAPDGNNNGRIDPGESALPVTVAVRNTGNVTATSVSATLSSLTPTVSVSSASSPYPSLPQNVVANNAVPFVIAISPSHPCGAPVNLRLAIASDQGVGTYDFAFPTGQPGGAATQTFSYAGPAVAIPDNNATGIAIPVTVAGLSGTISKLSFRFDGSSCVNTAGATTVGLDHSWVGDLIITLTSPQGTAITLVNRPGGGAGSSGNNFCATTFDDQSPQAIQAIATNGAGAPYIGAWAPASPLSAVNGQNPNGLWTLRVVDAASQDTGNVRAFSLIVQTTLPTVCDPPASSPICPSISAQPSPLTRCAGASATFSIAASGTPAPTYQWRKDTIDIPAATAPTLTIPAVSAADAASYDCVVSNACGSLASDPASLTVNPATTISAQPTPLSVCPGAPASFSVAASGSGPLTYQWRKNTVNIPAATAPTLSIPAASAADAASYDCVITASCGAITSSAASLAVNASTAITLSPAPASACEGSPASFSVAASGTGTLSYQWRKNAAPIPAATSPTFAIPAVASTDAASYDCLVSSDCGSAASSSALLTVNVAPSISAQPAPAVVCAGAPATFSVAAAATPAPTYQWRKDAVNIPAAIAPTFSIASPTAADAGAYDCVVSNPCGAITSSPALLTVNPATTITAQPNPVVACDAAPASFSITASGGSPGSLTYQWRKAGAPIPAATGPSFSIPAVSASDAAAYDCLVSSSCGDATSASVSLTVNVPPTIASTLAPNSPLCTGAPAAFSVSASGGSATAPLAYQWRKDNAPIPAATGPSFTIPAVALADAASYDCVVSNTCGTATSAKSNLVVNPPPSLQSQPSSASVCLGAPISFSVTASSTLPLTYQWRHNAVNIPGAQSPTYAIAAASAEDAGAYDCLVTSACATITSSAAALAVHAAPLITTQPADQTLPVGQTATFSVALADSNAATYQWSQNAVDIVDGPTPSGAVYSGAQTPVLTLSNAAEADSALIAVAITNPCGTASSSPAMLVVNGAGACPADFNADGALDPDDLSDYIGCFFTQACPPGKTADFNADAATDPDDLSDYIGAFFGGC